MDKRRIVLLALVIAFVAAGIALSRCTDDAMEAHKGGDTSDVAKVERKKVVYPRDRRLVRRRPADPGPGASDDKAPRREASTDPIVRAMSAPGKDGAIFVEVNAIRHSDIVEKVLACRQEEAFSELERMKNDLGIDLAEDVDRFALAEDSVAMSGFFEDLKLPPELGEGEAYGDEARLYRAPEPGGEGQGVLAVIGDNLVVVAATEEGARAAVDRVEGRADPGASLPRELFYSEVYGQMGPGLVQAMLAGAEDPVAAQLMELVDKGTVRMMFDEQVSLSLDFAAKSQEAGEDLAKAVGGALAGFRREAEQQGEEELAWLLEQARVLPGEDGRFGIDVAVPGELILKTMGCDEQGKRIGALRDDANLGEAPKGAPEP